MQNAAKIIVAHQVGITAVRDVSWMLCSRSEAMRSVPSRQKWLCNRVNKLLTGICLIQYTNMTEF